MAAMLGPVGRRFAVRAVRMRLVAAGVAAVGLLGAGAVTASAQLNLLSTPTPGCVLNALGTCLVGNTSSNTTPTPAPLCLAILCGPGSTTQGSTPNPTPTPCLLPQPICNPPATPNPQCTPLPGCLTDQGTPTPCPTNCSTRTTPGGTPSSRVHTPTPTSTSTPSGGIFTGGGETPGVGPTNPVVNLPFDVAIAGVPNIDAPGSVAGFHFGNAPVLWPLFGMLDALGLFVIYLVVRRLRSTEAD